MAVECERSILLHKARHPYNANAELSDPADLDSVKKAPVDCMLRTFPCGFHIKSAVNQAAIRFYAELNDFLPEGRKNQNSTYTFVVSGSVKDVIEALGVPHTEVDLILANGQSVDFSYRVRNGDRISVYPAFETIDISPLERLRPIPLREIRFVLDTHLGKLAAYMRMLGLDAAYSPDYSDEGLARISSDEKRILLTRDRGLLKRNMVIRGYFLRATNPREQLVEVLQRFDLVRSICPFERCIHCNVLLRPVPKEKVAERLLPETKQHYEEFRLCPECERIYWKGSHYRKMQRFVAAVRRKCGISRNDRDRGR